MNYPLLQLLNVIAICIEILFDVSKFALVHTIALAIITTEYVRSIDWAHVVVNLFHKSMRTIKDTQQYVNQQFVYA